MIILLQFTWMWRRNTLNKILSNLCAFVANPAGISDVLFWLVSHFALFVGVLLFSESYLRAIRLSNYLIALLVFHRYSDNHLYIDFCILFPVQCFVPISLNGLCTRSVKSTPRHVLWMWSYDSWGTRTINGERLYLFHVYVTPDISCATWYFIQISWWVDSLGSPRTRKPTLRIFQDPLNSCRECSSVFLFTRRRGVYIWLAL